jgi:CRISPR-associated protein Cas4
MESYIRISNINDFLYCPVSIYLHSLYEDFDRSAYHQTPQIVGTANHRSLDDGTYSTAKRYLTGLEVYSAEYGLCGKIDFYDSKEKLLVERKTRVREVQKGYVYQLYAQYLCMKEMGYEVERLALHSLEDNKRYPINLPGEPELAEFRRLLDEMRSFDPTKIRHHACDRCSQSIYGPLNW